MKKDNLVIKKMTGLLKRVLGSFVFKLMITSSVIMLTFSFLVYNFEKKHVFYTTENGVQVEDAGKSSNIRNFSDTVWWSIVTSTTVGYGDFYPKSLMGRMSGAFLMIFGISLMGVITGNIASSLVERQLREGRGMKQLKLKRHFIICGWKREMGNVLHDIMAKNPEFLANEIVLINSADQEKIDILKSEKSLSQVNFIFGDFIDEKVLNRANIKVASRVLILADSLVAGSVQEVDSRTVMGVMTIKSISKMVYIAAELLDPKFERYLRHANCDEIILSSAYNRLLIANASTGSGISHIISELLEVNVGSSIITDEIPQGYIGKPFEQLFHYYRENSRSILIGILENTGNFFTRRKEAIEQAQKTPDISKLVDNLKFVKSLSANEPVINPAPDYLVTDHSKAILIGRKGE